MRKIFIGVFLTTLLLLHGCSKKNDDPIEVIKDFIIYCEEGKIDKAEKLLAPKNNVDYFRTFKNKGKDLIYINYDYKGNDDVVELSFEKLNQLSSDEVAVIKMTSNYKKQQHSFDKNIVLHKIDGEWKIYEYLFMPVDVNEHIFE